MISNRVKNRAAKPFLEFASLFPDGIFVKAVTVYVDEAGTHDPTGMQSGSQVPIVAGFAAPPSEWGKFCIDWKAVLRSYGVDYFHAKELNAARVDLKMGRTIGKDNPYHKMDLPRMEQFVLTLSEIAGRGNKVPIAGGIRLRVFHGLKEQLALDNPDKIELGDNPYKYAMGEFFKNYHKHTWYRWGNFKCPVTFFFEDHPDPAWRSAVHEVYGAFKAKDKRLSGIFFADDDKEKMQYLPIQAADMIAHRVRQISGSRDAGKPIAARASDLLLFAGLFQPWAKELTL